MKYLHKPAMYGVGALLILALGLAPAALHARYSPNQAMTVTQLNGIDIAYTRAGSADAPPAELPADEVETSADAASETENQLEVESL